MKANTPGSASKLRRKSARRSQRGFVGRHGLFAPEHWRPHVTLGDLALTPAVVGAAIRHLVEGRRGHWTLEVDNVSMLAQGSGLTFELALRGQVPTLPRR